LRANLIEVRQKIRCSRSLCSSQDTDGNLAPSAHPRRASLGPYESAPWVSGCFLRTQQRARYPRSRLLLVPLSPEGKSVLTGLR
jgi:hypothetical protein